MVTVSEYLAGSARIIKAGEIESMQKQPNFIPLLAFFLANVIVNSAKYEVLGGLPITGIVTYLCSLPLKIMIDEKYFEISKGLVKIREDFYSTLSSTICIYYHFCG